MFDLKKFRKENGGITQVQLAEMFNCTQGNINSIESTGRDLTDEQMLILISKFGKDVVDKYLTIEVNMNNTINSRILIVANKKFDGNITKMCRSIGVSQAAMSNIVTGRMSKPSFDVINAFVEKANVNADWIITGNGQPFDRKEEIPKISFTNGVPYYNVDFLGGFDLVTNDQTINPEYLIDFKKYNEADCWCNVTGHSMEPEITHGDIIAMKKIEDFSFLPLGEVYAIVTTNGMRTIKRLGPGSSPNNYSLVPTNKAPEYGIQELPRKMISIIFQVLGCMKRL